MNKVNRRTFLSGAAVAGASSALGAMGDRTFSYTNQETYRTGTMKEKLVEHMEGLTIIDAHEHMMSEDESLEDGGIDIMGAMLTQYIPTSFNSAGMEKKREWLTDKNVPLDERWGALKSYLPLVAHTGYYRTANMVVQALYGLKRLDESNFYKVNDLIKNDLKPGYYNRILKNHCKIERVLNQRPWGKNEGYEDFVTDISREPIQLQYGLNSNYDSFKFIWEKYGAPGMNVNELTEKWICALSRNHHGVKIQSGVPFPKPSFEEAQTQFDKYLKDNTCVRRTVSLYLLHKAIELCGQYNLVVAVHCGIIWDCWNDFYATAISNIVQAVMTYRHTTFDLYHASIPWVREAGVAGNQYPNVNLNLTWAHEISPAMTLSFLDEWIDLVPLNKIIGFGADGRTPFLTAGVRRRTFDNIAEVLSSRVMRDEMNLEEAEEICRWWLYDNPKRIYRL